MKRHDYQNDGLRLSYLDAGGSGAPLIALHAHWMEGVTYEPLAAALAPAWRVIAPDQRGHGHSDHAPSYGRDDYLGDLQALYEHLGLHDAVLLGNSLGGVNAYQFAARHPQRVRGLIIEEIGTIVSDDASFVLPWSGVFPSREALEERLGPRFAPYLEPSFRETPGGWRLAFEPRDMVASQAGLGGDHWADWLASDCPALVVRGRDSRVTDPDIIRQMGERRRNTRVVTLDAGHVVHMDAASDFEKAVRAFLDRL
ncbi:MAG: alpha/beta hydrolase [Gemmatimonadota bacterium]